MYEITYYSIAKSGISTKEINDILISSRDFNSKYSITGCLLYHHDQFIQVLEGDKDVISKLLSKISNDKRHSEIIVLAEGEKEERTFHSWTMAYRELNDSDIKDIGDSLFINNFLTFSSLVEKPTHTIKKFWAKAQQLLTDNFTS